MKPQYRRIAIIVLGTFILSCALFTAPLSQNPVGQSLQNTPLAPNSATQLPPITAPNQIPGSAFGADLTLEGIFNEVQPSVVNVQSLLPSSSVPVNANGTNNNPTPNAPAGVSGSGFVWDSAGHIVTNDHVVDGSLRTIVFFSDGTEADATVVGTDKNSDLAVLQVNVPKELLHPVTIGDSNSLKVGETVVAIGYPFGLDITMTKGIISGLARTIPVGNGTAGQTAFTIPDLIQTDAPINPGNSGGVLLNENGEVVGITNAIISPVDASVGVGFAIPSAILKKVVPVLISDGKFIHTYIGIQGGTLTSDLAKAMNLNPSTRGILVGIVDKNGPAGLAGLLGSTEKVVITGVPVMVGGDIITAIDGHLMKTFDDMVSYLFLNSEVGQTMSLAILRNGQPMSLNVTLAARPGS
jgi:serine protease Do